MTKLTFDVDFNKDPEEILREIQERAKAEVAKRESKIRSAAYLSKLHEKVNDEIGTEYKSINDLIRGLTQFANPKLKERISSSSPSGRRVTISMSRDLFEDIKSKLAQPNPNKAAIARETGASVVQVRKVANGGYDAKFSAGSTIATTTEKSSQDSVADNQTKEIDAAIATPEPTLDPAPSVPEPIIPPSPAEKEPAKEDSIPELPPITPPSIDEDSADEPAPSLDLPPLPSAPEPIATPPVQEDSAPEEPSPDLPPIAPPSMGEDIADEPAPIAPPPAPSLDLPPEPPSPVPSPDAPPSPPKPSGGPAKPSLSLKPKPGAGGKPGKPTLSLKSGKKKTGGLKITRPPMKPPSA